jgi:hypothetical protein
VNLEFGSLNEGDVLQDFDFDSFLQHDSNDAGGFSFDPNFSFGNPELEAGTGE